jgi:hypothetical protein
MSFRVKPSPRFQREDPIDLPLTRHVYDDEFESTVLDPSWTRFGNAGPGLGFDDVTPIDPAATFASGGTRWSLHGAPAPNARPSWYLLQTDPTTIAGIEKTVVLPSEYFAWARFSFAYRNSGQTNNDGTAQLDIMSGAGPAYAEGVSIYLNESDANTVQVEAFRWNASVGTSIGTTNNVGGAGLTRGQVMHTVGIQAIGTTYHYWIMNAAGNWQWVGTTTHATALNLARLRVYSAVATSPGNVVIGIDFFRFKEGRFLP